LNKPSTKMSWKYWS